MKPIRTVAFAVTASVVLAGAAAGCRPWDADRAARDVFIAADLELSGPGAPLGAVHQRALELKVEQVNASGVLGDRTLRLRYRDNRSDPAESIRNIGAFADDPAVSAVVMGGCNECATVAAPTVDERRIPVVALATAGAVASPVAERRYVFKLSPDASDSAAALAAELRRRGVPSVGLLTTDDSYGIEGTQTLTAELGKVGIALVRTATVHDTDTDLTSMVGDLLAARPAALVVWAPAAQATAAAVSAKAAGFTGQLWFDSVAAADLFLPADAARAADNAAMVFTPTMVVDEVISSSPAKAARTRWFREYTARYGGYHGYSSFAADAVRLVVDAMLAAGGDGVPDRDAIRDRLEGTQVDGLSGPIRMSPGDHSGLAPEALRTLVVRGGRWRLGG